MILTFLWTDIMVWLLVVALVVWGYVISRSLQVQRQWRAIFKSSLALVSSIVLLVYLAFALLDSVHFHKAQSSEMVSLLDMAFEHRIKETERTYSAPFATHEYAKSLVVKNGVSRQEYLPLKYVKSENIVSSSLFALVVGLLLSFVLIVLHLVWRKQKG